MILSFFCFPVGKCSPENFSFPPMLRKKKHTKKHATYLTLEKLYKRLNLMVSMQGSTATNRFVTNKSACRKSFPKPKGQHNYLGRGSVLPVSAKQVPRHIVRKLLLKAGTWGAQSTAVGHTSDTKQPENTENSHHRNHHPANSKSWERDQPDYFKIQRHSSTWAFFFLFHSMINISILYNIKF